MAEGKKKILNKILLVLLYYIFIPLVASVIGTILGAVVLSFITIPCAIVILYKKMPEKIRDWDLIRRVNGIVVLLLFLNFTVLVVLSSGEFDSELIRRYLFVAAFPYMDSTILNPYDGVMLYNQCFNLWCGIFYGRGSLQKENFI